MNVADIRKNIKSISTKRASLVTLIQATAIACIRHAHEHGDVTVANELAVAVGAGMKHESMRLYLAEFGPMNPNADAKAKDAAPMIYSKAKLLSGEELAAMMAKAEATDWHSFKTEKPAEEFSFDAMLQALLRKVEKAGKEGKFEATEAQAALLHTIKQAVQA